MSPHLFKIVCAAKPIINLLIFYRVTVLDLLSIGLKHVLDIYVYGSCWVLNRFKTPFSLKIGVLYFWFHFFNWSYPGVNTVCFWNYIKLMLSNFNTTTILLYSTLICLQPENKTKGKHQLSVFTTLFGIIHGLGFSNYFKTI
jgi:hypothetical protein